jgi:putative nucleotidyltransferase with HDIG domain
MHNLFMNKPWPILALVGFIIGFILMGIMVLYRRVFGNFQGILREMQEFYLSVLRMLSEALEIKDTYTRGHSDRVSLFATALAVELGLSDKDVELIKEVAIFHDIGKIGIPEHVLRKTGSLSEKEWVLIKDHPLMSAKILEPLKYLREGIPIVRHHHERYDGKGYPDGLSGDQIPLGARIIALADTLDAMTSARSYCQALSSEEVKKKIEESSGSQFDPRVVNIFLRLWDKNAFQQHIEKSA